MESVYWRCHNCERLFKSPVYEPYCPECAGYPNLHVVFPHMSVGSYRRWESLVTIAIVFAAMVWMFW